MATYVQQGSPNHDQAAVLAFLEDLKTLCERHRMRLIGTCENEGILGEIRIEHLDNPVGGWVTDDAPYVLSKDTILPATTLRYYFPTPPKASEHQG